MQEAEGKDGWGCPYGEHQQDRRPWKGVNIKRMVGHFSCDPQIAQACGIAPCEKSLAPMMYRRKQLLNTTRTMPNRKQIKMAVVIQLAIA